MIDVQITDIALFVVAGTTCAYCFILSQRLKSLQNTKDGLGATIVAFSKSIADMSSSTKETNLRARQIAQNLTTAIETAERSTLEMNTLLDRLEAKEQHLTHKVTRATQTVDQDLQIILDEAKHYTHEIAALLGEIKTLPSYAGKQQNMPAMQPNSAIEMDYDDLF